MYIVTSTGLILLSQVTIYLLERLGTVLAKCSEEDVRVDILPMVFAALESNSLPTQDAAVSALCTIQKYLSDAAIRNLVLPKAKALFTKSTSVKVHFRIWTSVDFNIGEVRIGASEERRTLCSRPSLIKYSSR
jgi:hypothetical protein